MKEFYMVVNLQDNISMTFATSEEASEYAKQMAKDNIGQEYFIMRAMWGYAVKNPTPEFIGMES